MFAYPTAEDGTGPSARKCAPELALPLALSLVCSLALAPMLAVPARAQQPSASALAVARELVTVKGVDKFWQPLIAGVVEQSRRVLLQSNPMLGKDLNEIAVLLQAEYAPRKAELMNDVARLYATRFTEQELKDTLAFYKSPLGRKLLTEEPVLVEESMRNAQTWGDKLSEQVIARFRAEMRKRGHEI
jgi:uncharacterized protein